MTIPQETSLKLNHAQAYKPALLAALAQFGHNAQSLDQHALSPVALARRAGVPEGHLTAAFELAGYPVVDDATPEPGTPNLYVGLYNGDHVYAADDPFDDEAQAYAGGLVAFRKTVTATPIPEVRNTAKPTAGRMRTIMDALHVLGHGDVRPSELSEPNYHRTLLAEGRITHEQLAQAYAHYTGKPFIDPKRAPPHADVRELLSTALINQYRIIPYARTGNTLTVLQADPTDTFSLVAVQDETQGMDIVVAVASEPDIEHLILTLYRRAVQDELLRQEAAGRSQDVRETVSTADPNSPVTQRIRSALEEASLNGASDIHFQPERGGVMVRERLHGNLVTKGTVPAALGPQLINQLKMMAGMNLESRVPQDRRIATPMTIRGKQTLLRLRVSCLPSNHGDSIVMRLLPDVETLPTLQGTGFSEHNRALVEDATASSNGMLLVTGPTGSGKTTLMHTLLKGANAPDTKIMAIEDPIEYEQPLIVQTEIRRSDDKDNDLSFARVLRSQLRQDPDIIFVGEIRDEETAGVAVQAAQTGHLLLSTLHTNNAVATISRLMDLGVPPYLVAESLRVVISQRLVGRPCPECSEETEVPPTYADRPGRTMLQGTGVKDGAPCALCHGTGDYKVIPVHEVLPVTNEVRVAIASSDVTAVAAAAGEAGLRTLLQDGLEKVYAHKANLRSVLENVR